MPFGDLDRRITLENYSTSRDSYGQETKTWSVVATVWASIGYEQASEKYMGDQLIAPTIITFLIRYRSGVNEKYRLQYNSVYYDILSVQEVDRKRYMMIRAEHRDNRT